MRWQGALKADTVLGYRRFIADYPESIYRSQAETQLAIIDETAWRELAAENSVPAYEHYLKGMSLWHERTVPSLTKSIEEF